MNIENQIFTILRNYLYSWVIFYFIFLLTDLGYGFKSETSETSDTFLSQSSSEDTYSLKRQDAFSGKLMYALRTKTIDIKEILYKNIQGKDKIL